MRVHRWLAGSALLLGTLTALTACGGGGFELSIPSPDVEIVQGAAAYVELELDRQGGFTGAVDLSVQGLPQGVVATWEPQAVEGEQSILRLRADEEATVGTYAISIDARSGRLQQAANLTLHISPRPDFRVRLDPSALSVEQGMHASAVVTIQRQGEFAEQVSVELEEIPDGLSAELVPEGEDEDMLYLTAYRDTPAGEYAVSLAGHAQDRQRSAVLRVTVEAVRGFDLTADPSSVQLEREETQVLTVLVERWEEFAAPVHLQVITGLPEGVEAVFEPNPAQEDASYLTLAASDTARLGTYTLTVRGTANGLTEEIPIDMVVVRPLPQPPNDEG